MNTETQNPASTPKPKNTDHLSEWKKVKIGDITKLVSRGIYPSYVNSEGITILNQKCIRGGKIDFSLSKLTSLNKSYNPEKKLQKCDILINSTGVGTAGRVSIFKSNIECYADTHISIVRVCKEKSDPEFIFYNLFGRENEIEGYAEGSTGQIELGRDIIRNLEILLPPLPEQQAIAEVLSSLDDKIDLLHRQNKTLEALAETLFRQWFVEEAKEEWEEVELGSVVETTSGGTPSRSNINFYQNGRIPWVKSKELNGSYIFETEELITNEALKKSSAKILPENSILIAMYGATVGEYAIIAKEMTCNQAICALKPNINYPHTFLFLLIKHKKQELINMAVGSAQQNISQLLIKQILVPYCTEIIREFHLKVEPLFQKIKSNTQQIRTLTQLRDTLLPKLMSGEIRLDH